MAFSHTHTELADPVIVSEITRQLTKALEDYLKNFDGQVDFIDIIMAVVNLAYQVVDRLEAQAPNTPVWRNAMLVSLQKALYPDEIIQGRINRWALFHPDATIPDIYSVQTTREACIAKFERDFGYAFEDGKAAGWECVSIRIEVIDEVNPAATA